MVRQKKGLIETKEKSSRPIGSRTITEIENKIQGRNLVAMVRFTSFTLFYSRCNKKKNIKFWFKKYILNLRDGDRVDARIALEFDDCKPIELSLAGLKFRKSQISIVSSWELDTIWNSSNCKRNTLPVCSCKKLLLFYLLKTKNFKCEKKVINTLGVFTILS